MPLCLADPGFVVRQSTDARELFHPLALCTQKHQCPKRSSAQILCSHLSGLFPARFDSELTVANAAGLQHPSTQFHHGWRLTRQTGHVSRSPNWGSVLIKIATADKKKKKIGLSARGCSMAEAFWITQTRESTCVEIKNTATRTSAADLHL